MASSCLQRKDRKKAYKVSGPQQFFNSVWFCLTVVEYCGSLFVEYGGLERLVGPEGSVCSHVKMPIIFVGRDRGPDRRSIILVVIRRLRI
jgi:hypothetical protein